MLKKKQVVEFTQSNVMLVLNYISIKANTKHIVQKTQQFIVHN